MSAMQKTNGQRLFRLLEIIQLIKVSPSQTPQQLCSHLGIGMSRFYQDKELLHSYGFEFSYSRSQKKFLITKEPFLPTIHLTLTEMFSLVMALRQVSAKKDHAIAAFGIKALQKLIAATDESYRHLLQHALDDLTLEEGLGCNPDHLELLWTAIRENKRVTLWHTSPQDGIERECEFAPYVLFFRKRALYVDGYRPTPNEHKGFRTFRVNRIRNVLLQANRYPQHDEYEFASRWQHVFHLYGAGQKPSILKLQFTAKAAPYIKEIQWHHSQSISNLSDGGCVLTLDITDHKEAIRELMPWAPEMHILAPTEMRQWLCDQLTAALQRNQEGISP